jgi:hypothetical protein
MNTISMLKVYWRIRLFLYYFITETFIQRYSYRYIDAHITFAEDPGVSSLLSLSLQKDLLGVPGFKPRACLTAGQRTNNRATLHPTELRCTANLISELKNLFNLNR